MSARADARALSLADAVEAALRVEPIVAEARIADDRSKLGVLRAQLDRVTLKADASLQELWNKQNIGGPSSYTCTIAGVTFIADQATCSMQGGTPMRVSDENGIGLLNLSTSLNVPVFSGFRVSSNVKRAQLTHDATTVGIRQARKDTALSVARAYWAVRRVEMLTEVQAASLARLREAEVVSEGRLRAGLAPPIDANRAKVRRIQQEATLADLDGQAKEALAQLAVSLAIAEPIVLTDGAEVFDAPPPSVADLLELAKGRPEIESARLSVEVQRQIVRMVQSGWYPQLSLSALFQVGNNPYLLTTGARSVSANVNPFANVTGNLTVGATASINLFDTFNTWTSAKDAKYEEARLVEERRRMERIVEADVRAAHARLGRLFARRAPLVAAAEVARDNLKILEARYKNGDALVIELLEAQNDLAAIELTLADVTAQQQIARLELDAALGKTVGRKP